MSEAVERLGKALAPHTHGRHGSFPMDGTVVLADSAQIAAFTILAADPALAEAIELGLAWQAAEVALPEGRWRMGIAFEERTVWMAWAYGPDPKMRATTTGPTPAAALRALAAKLREPNP